MFRKMLIAAIISNTILLTYIMFLDVNLKKIETNKEPIQNEEIFPCPKCGSPIMMAEQVSATKLETICLKGHIVSVPIE